MIHDPFFHTTQHGTRPRSTVAIGCGKNRAKERSLDHARSNACVACGRSLSHCHTSCVRWALFPRINSFFCCFDISKMCCSHRLIKLGFHSDLAQSTKAIPPRTLWGGISLLWWHCSASTASRSRQVLRAIVINILSKTEFHIL